MSIVKLTRKQAEVIRFLTFFFERNGFAPSLKEIASNFKVSVPTAQNYLAALVYKGAIGRNPNKPRSIIFKEEKPKNMTISIPLLGVISAGEGIVVNEESEPELVEAPATMIGYGFSHYALKASGFSMVGDGIMDGDTIVVRQQAIANPGDTVVAILKGNFEEKATLKRFYPKSDVIELQPRNPLMCSIKVLPENLEIRGKFCGLIRRG
jgi:repressor LexA